MKKMKKLVSLLLALVMTFAMTSTVFATQTTSANTSGEETNFSITVYNQRDGISMEGQTYNAYKLFDVTYDLKNEAYVYTVTDNFKNFSYEEKSGTDLIASLQGKENDAAFLHAFANTALEYIKAQNIQPNGSQTADATNKESVTIDLSNKETQGPGYYLVAGQVKATNDDGTTSDDNMVTAACILTTTNPTQNIQVKADAPSIDKVIVQADSANGEDGNGTAQDVGSVVNFKLTSTVPVMTGYTEYTYIVHDTMSSGLTFDSKSVKVKIGDVDYTDFTVNTENVDPDTFQIVFDNFIAQAANAGKKIEITYSAILNKNALNTDEETNTVNLEYSNNPYDNESKDKTPDKTVYVYDFDIVINKYGDDNKENKLAGAEFILQKGEGEDVQYYVLNEDKETGEKSVTWTKNKGEATIITTGADGKAKFVGLDSGNYQLVETKAPDGYNKLTEDVEVTITIEYNEDGSLKTSSAQTSVDGGQLEQESEINNQKGSLLPSTGGIGTTIFYIVGTILVVGAGILLVTKRRMKEQ